MPAWVDCRFGSNWFGDWAADMGEYIGPWPLMPTPIIDQFTDDGDEIDLVLGFPNPSDPTDPNIALDGSYDAQVWDAYRTRDDSAPANDSRIGWITGHSGAATNPDGSTPAPSGVHLYVVSYRQGDESVAPAWSPESFVPTSYAADGTATNETLPGHWSDWQAALPVSGSAPWTNGPAWASPQTESVVGDAGDLTTLGDSAVVASIAGALWVDPDIASPTPLPNIFDAFVQKLAPAGDAGSTTAAIGTAPSSPGQGTYRLHADPTLPNPLTSLTLDVDYGDQPFNGDDYEYEAGDAVIDAWSGSLGGVTNTAYPSRIGSGSSTDMAGQWRIQQIAGLPTLGGTAVAAGSALLDIDVGGPGTPDGSASDIAWPGSITIDGGGNDRCIAIGPSFLNGVDSSALFPNIATNGACEILASITPDFEPVDFTGHTQRWRYWTPYTIGPAIKWHTVCGHWGDIGGVSLRILTPINGQLVGVDVVDGPG